MFDAKKHDITVTKTVFHDGAVVREIFEEVDGDTLARLFALLPLAVQEGFLQAPERGGYRPFDRTDGCRTAYNVCGAYLATENLGTSWIVTFCYGWDEPYEGIRPEAILSNVFVCRVGDDLCLVE
jgi:hypothetical protein